MIRNICILIAIVVTSIYLVNGNYAQAVAMCILVASIIEGNKCKYSYNPFFLLIITLVSFLLYNPQWGGVFFSALSYKTQAVICFSLIALFAGMRLCMRFQIHPLIVGKKTENILIVGALGLLPTLVSFAFFGNILVLSGDALLEAKEGLDIPIVGQLAFFLPATIIIACKRNSSKLIILAIIVSVLSALMTVTKMAILMAVFFSFVGLNRFSPSFLENKFVKSIKRYAAIWVPICVLLMFSNNNAIRTDAQGGEMTYYSNSGSMMHFDSSDEFAEGIFLNYLYFCSPWSNLDYNIERNNRRGYGANTFGQFGKRFGMEVQPVEKIQPSFLNTHTFLTDYILDFGLLGAVIASFFLGLFISYGYCKWGCSDDPIWLSFYTLIAFATSMLFFSNHFNNGYLFNYFLSFGIYYLISKTVQS